MEGADTKSVSVAVDSRGSWWWGSEAGREQLGNWSSGAASLVVLAKVSVPFLRSTLQSKQQNH